LQSKPTDELNELLENMRPDQLDSYMRENEKYLADSRKGFSYYFKDVLADKRIKLKDVYMIADVSESYGSKILSMEKHAADRDLILRLCIAGHFNLIEINRALKLYGMSELYAKDKRDACIIVAINNRIYEPYKIDDILIEHGFKKLT